MTRFIPTLPLLLWLLSSCGFVPVATSPTPTPVIITVVVTATSPPATLTPSLAAADLQATATVQSVRATAQAIIDHAAVVFGPQNRTISLTTRGFHGYGTDKVFTDFITEARWYNPYMSSGEDSWSYGYVGLSHHLGSIQSTFAR